MERHSCTWQNSFCALPTSSAQKCSWICWAHYFYCSHVSQITRQTEIQKIPRKHEKFFSCECGMGSQQQHTFGYVFTNLSHAGTPWFPISCFIEDLWDNLKTRLQIAFAVNKHIVSKSTCKNAIFEFSSLFDVLEFTHLSSCLSHPLSQSSTSATLTADKDTWGTHRVHLHHMALTGLLHVILI